MIRTLKAGRTQEAKAQSGAEARATVEAILADVEEQGDAALANDLGPHGITANAVSPGLTCTPGVEVDVAAGTLPEDVFDAMNRVQAIPRPGTPDDLVGLVLFLTGKEASFVTGQFIVADGGATRR